MGEQARSQPPVVTGVNKFVCHTQAQERPRAGSTSATAPSRDSGCPAEDNPLAGPTYLPVAPSSHPSH